MNIGDDLGDMVIGTFTIPTENGMETDQGENHLTFGFYMCANFQLPGIFSRKDFQPIMDLEEALPDDIDRFLAEELPESQLLEQGENHKL